MATDFEGFDLYNGVGANTGLLSGFTSTGTTGTSLVSGRFGGQAYALTSGNCAWRKSLSFSTTTGSAGLALYITNIPISDATPTQCNAFFALSSGLTQQLMFRINASGGLTVYRGVTTSTLQMEVNGTALGSSANGLFSINTWYWLDIEFGISDTTGYVRVYQNGDPTPIINLSNIDTRNGTPTTVDSYEIGATYSGTGTTLYRLDDIYVTDSATRLGDSRVEVNYVVADTAQKDFTPSTGTTNYNLVDDPTVNGDTDYVQSGTVGHLDLYTTEAMATTPSTIHSVKLSAFAVKTDAAARAVALVAQSGATVDQGSDLYLPSSYGKLERYLPVDPATTAAWTASGVNALKVGPKVTV